MTNNARQRLDTAAGGSAARRWRRRGWLPVMLIVLLAAASVEAADSDGVHRAHAIAMHGQPRYGPDFRHFDYVNPEAPVGGTLRLGVTGTFDSFNPYIPKGNAAAGVGAETLTVASEDEPFTRYGLIAESIEWPDDRSWVRFTLREEARWHDGRPITVEDVIFSFDTLKTKGQPFYRFYYASIVGAEKVGPRTVEFRFSEAGNRELPLIAGEIPILPYHYWRDRDFSATTLEPPLSSGPYRVTGVDAGRRVVVERVADYWGRELPVNRGINNFQRISYEYFRDDTVLRQALKGGVIDFRIENQAKAWALDYDVPAVRDGWLIKETVPHERPAGMQAFVFNTRRALFADPTVRRALAFAFDFEWTNRILFFDQYVRTTSYFANSELASRGLPEGEERRLLETFRGQLADEVFTTPFHVPATDGSGWPRDNLEHALRLLGDAGWHVRDLRLVNDASGEAFRFEILIVSPTFERVMLPFTRNLKRLGIEARVRLVDQTQYINRIRDYDFDMAMLVWGQSDSPGNEQRSFWGSQAAETPGSRNWAGIRDPVVDALIEQVITAPTRENLVTRVRALDRVLLWGHYVIPAWHLSADRVLYWDKFGRPAVTAPRGVNIDHWWSDPDRAERLRLRTADVGDNDTADRPAAGVVLAAAAAIGLLGFWLVRRALRRRMV